ncbi:MAG: BatD family protein [Limisphaerales bacterium]
MHAGFIVPSTAGSRRRSLQAGRPAAWLLAGCLLLATCANVTRAATFTATLDRDTTTVGEPVTLSLIFGGAQPTRVFGMPQVQGLALQGQGSKMQSDSINGQMSVQFIYLYAATPQHAGEFTIPAIRAEVDGQTLTSQPLKLKALPAGQVNPDAGGVAQFAFLKLIVPRNEVYIGEVFPVDVWLYVQSGQDLELPQLKGEGFTFGPMAKPTQTRTQVNNAIYNVVSFKLTATPAKNGTLTLGPAGCSLTLRIPRTNRRARDPSGFDPLDFFSSPYELRKVTLTSEAQTIRARPLPTTNAPANFTGAMGSFSVSLHASPTNVAVGDPITVTVRIEGRGNFDALNLPPQAGWGEFKIYPPTSKVATTDPLGLQGVKTFEQVIIPQNTEIKELPAFAFSFFDPERKDYRTETLAATPLVVRPTAATQAPPLLATKSESEKNNSPPPQDIVAIKQHPGRVAVLSPPLIRQPWFLALQGLPALAWLSTLTWRKRRDRLANNPRLRRQRQVARVIRKGLADLRQSAEANDAEAFFAGVFRLLQEQIGERIDLPASAITEAVLEERLRPLGVPEANLATLHELFQACNQARYAPQPSRQALASLLPKVESALLAIRRVVYLALLLGVIMTAGVRLQAGATSAGFDQANKLYERGQFKDAVAAYENLIHTGKVSSEIYFNLGNACFKSGQIGRAIAAYRAAESLAPRDPDVLANLKFARESVGRPAIGGSRWLERLRKLTLDEWAILTAGATWIWFALLTARQWRPDLKKTFSGYTSAVGGAAVALAACLGATGYDRLSHTAAVVIAREAVARYGPLDEAQSAFTLPDGTEVMVLDHNGDWLEVETGDRRTAWVRRTQVAILTAAAHLEISTPTQ